MTKGIYKHKPHSEETRKKISAKLKGRHQSEETKKKISANCNKGNKHYKWKGDNAKKITIHKFIAKYKPKPLVCEQCGSYRKLNLANIKNHNYSRDINDYKWLCYSCHGNMDKNKDFCKNGHKLEGNNLIVNNRGHRVCRECKKTYNSNYKIDKLAGSQLVEK